MAHVPQGGPHPVMVMVPPLDASPASHASHASHDVASTASPYAIGRVVLVAVLAVRTCFIFIFICDRAFRVASPLVQCSLSLEMTSAFVCFLFPRFNGSTRFLRLEKMNHVGRTFLRLQGNSLSIKQSTLCHSPEVDVL